MTFSAKPLLLVSAISLASLPLSWAEDTDTHLNNDPINETETVADAPEITVIATDDEPDTDTEAGHEKGKITVEFSIDEGETDSDDDDDVKVTIKKNGRELSQEETDAELEQWEQEIMETLDGAFRGTPRKGIFALQQDRDGGFAELGFGLKYSDGLTMMREGYEGLEFTTEFNIGIQLAGLFYEYFSASDNRGLFGYNFYNSDWVGLDLIVGKEHYDFADDKEDKLLLPIEVRHGDWTGGLRSTVYLGPLVVQGQVRREISDYHNGYTASLQTGTNIQIKNLNIHGLVGASYQSEEVMDYYYGVTAAEASSNFAAYDPGEDIRYNAEIGASYPMSKNWILRGQVNYTQYSDDLVNSPFWDGDNTEHLSSRIMLLLVM
ncbi:MipA/OmpV family protein [Reinekea sp. G2M2-21]|uniref:MipA/OmpV family protein n=1 Tax=Reinekea sp. G2M2-21 TaxID=2788942 RepID=UPI0018AA6473|nr:MipA/OmpV family protein [Reinekea sp. G2M2-21]